jgi:hypothetical protein
VADCGPSLDDLVNQIANTNPLKDPERFDELVKQFLDEWAKKHG